MCDPPTRLVFDVINSPYTGNPVARLGLADPVTPGLPSGRITSSRSQLLMGLFKFLWRLLGWSGTVPAPRPAQAQAAGTPTRRPRVAKPRFRRKARHVTLRRLRYHGPQQPRLTLPKLVFAKAPPYRFAQPDGIGRYYDFTGDAQPEMLARFGLPVFTTPQDIADWLHLPLGRLAWLIHRTSPKQCPDTAQASHYHYHWLKKRSGGQRLIEAPKALLKYTQQKILREILDRIPVHSNCHGFTIGKSILTNALPHTRQRVLVKLDLRNFYTSINFSRIVAIFRSLGYCREAALWLARLTTSAWPTHEPFPTGVDVGTRLALARRHLPQGAPTSPALANLSAFSLDLRLTGLARAYNVKYTRYADDLTFSGPGRFLPSLPNFLQVVQKVIRAERFVLHPGKRRVIRENQRQTVTGVVVNDIPNVPRPEYDRIKAILTNCVRKGPSTQNHAQHPEFAQQLLGKIGHVKQLHPARGEKLLALYRQIDWNT